MVKQSFGERWVGAEAGSRASEIDLHTLLSVVRSMRPFTTRAFTASNGSSSSALMIGVDT